MYRRTVTVIPFTMVDKIVEQKYPAPFFNIEMLKESLSVRPVILFKTFNIVQGGRAGGGGGGSFFDGLNFCRVLCQPL